MSPEKTVIFRLDQQAAFNVPNDSNGIQDKRENEDN